MPYLGMALSISPAALVAAGLKKDGPPIRIPLLAELDKVFKEQSGRSSRISTANEADEGLFSAELNRLRPRVEAMGNEDIGTLGGVINRLGNTSAMDTYRGIGDYQKSLIDSVASNLAQRGMAGLNLRRAKLGYGGRGGGSFDTAQITNRISQNLAPVYANAFANIGRDTQTVSGADINNINTLLQVIGERAGIPLRGLDLFQLAAMFRNQNQGDELANLGSLTNTVKAGTAGWRPPEQSTLYRIFSEAGDQQKSVSGFVGDLAGDIVKMYAGGGMGGAAGGVGSMLGGMGGGGSGGGGAAPARTAPSNIWNYASPATGFSPGPANYYNGGFGY